jgi:hypothetical protein
MSEVVDNFYIFSKTWVRALPKISNEKLVEHLGFGGFIWNEKFSEDPDPSSWVFIHSNSESLMETSCKLVPETTLQLLIYEFDKLSKREKIQKIISRTVKFFERRIKFFELMKQLENCYISDLSEDLKEIVKSEYITRTYAKPPSYMLPNPSEEILEEDLDGALMEKFFGPVCKVGIIEDDGILECKRFGGCRMLTCRCRDIISSSCDSCNRKIKDKRFSVRKPHKYGGWEGTYCSVNCLKKKFPKISEEKFSGMKIFENFPSWYVRREDVLEFDDDDF